MLRRGDRVKPLLSNLGGASPTAYELDEIYALPPAARLRTIHLLALSVAVLSIAAAIEWPRAWQLVALADLAATSVLFALAAGREWFLRSEARRQWHSSWTVARRAAALHVRPLLESQACSVAAGSTF
jgi:hypothetical protein